MELTLLYCTDNSLDPEIATVVRSNLLYAARGKPIVCVSQIPTAFGLNICIGKIGRSLLSLLKQIQCGLEHISTPYVAMTEHDCLYVPEHFEFQPQDDATYYFNTNCWYVRWQEEWFGRYSQRSKATRPLSQMICSKKALAALVSIRAEQLRNLGAGTHIRLEPDKHTDVFETQKSNLDIRHETNYTGDMSGDKHTFVHPDWGLFCDVIKSIKTENKTRDKVSA